MLHDLNRAVEILSSSMDNSSSLESEIAGAKSTVRGDLSIGKCTLYSAFSNGDSLAELKSSDALQIRILLSSQEIVEKWIGCCRTKLLE